MGQLLIIYLSRLRRTVALAVGMTVALGGRGARVEPAPPRPPEPGDTAQGITAAGAIGFAAYQTDRIRIAPTLGGITGSYQW